MAEPSASASGAVQNFLSKDTAGLPNWAWILVVGAGIAVTYFLPKFLAGKNTTATDTTGTTGQSTSGIGLAVDPTTGLPYAVSGLVPSGAITTTSDLSTPPPIQPPTTILPGPLLPQPVPGQPPQAPSWTSILGTVPNWSTINIGGMQPNGMQRYWYTPKGGKGVEFDAPPGSKINYGGDGRVWITPPGQQGVLLTGGGQGGPSPEQVSPVWPGGTTQIRMVA